MMKHFVATAYIVASIEGEPRVLLHKHKKLGIWIGIGGHIERNENMVEALLREIKEETGLTVEIITPKAHKIATQVVKELPRPEVILEENIPSYGKNHAHKHIDCIYFAIANHPELLRMKEEFVWASLPDLEKRAIPKEVHILAKKAFVMCRTRLSKV